MSRPLDSPAERVYELATLTVDGFGDVHAERELAKLLEGSAKARRAYISFMQESAALRWQFGGFSSLRSDLSQSKREPFLGWQRFMGAKFFAVAATLLVVLTASWFIWDTHQSVRLAQNQQAGESSVLSDPSTTGILKDTADQLHPSDSIATASSGVATLTHITNVQWDDNRPAVGELSRLEVGQEICFASGKVKLVYDAGVEVVLTGPCRFEILSASSAFCRQGVIAARVGKSGRGFTVETPYAQIIDLGTEFGVQVNEEVGSAEVVVFKGSVDLEYASDTDDTGRERRRLFMGEGAQVNRRGTLSRVVSISSGQFGRNEQFSSFSTARPALITSVQDNIKRSDSMKFYEIVHAGMREDALAYVDRPEHQWNGITDAGMPPYLIGGDYVKFFNDDKVTEEFEVWLTIAHPASLFVLFDDRSVRPNWLIEQFVDTGNDIGLDVAPYTFRGKTFTWNDRVSSLSSAIGPGNSVDDVLSVWRMDVPVPRQVLLGAGGENVADLTNVTMYGVVAVPLIKNAGSF